MNFSNSGIFPESYANITDIHSIENDMAAKVKKQPFMDEDALFLILKLIDYPDMELKTFNFDELMLLNFKKPFLCPAFSAVSEINKEYGMHLDNFQFDRQGFFYLENHAIKNHFNELIHANPIKKIDIPLKKVIEGNFVLTELEQLAKEQPRKFPLVLSGANFKISVTNKLQDDLISYLKKYVKIFRKNQLRSVTQIYWNRDEHEKIFQTRAGDDFDRYKKVDLVLKDFEFEKEFRLLECVLMLDFNGDIKINNITSVKNADKKNEFAISVELSDIFLKKIKKSKMATNDVDPRCFIEANTAFFQVDDESAPISIGRADTQKYRLLKCLTDNFNVARSIESAFDIACKKGFNRTKGMDPRALPIKEKTQILVDTCKDLHRSGVPKEFKFKIGAKFSIIYINFI